MLSFSITFFITIVNVTVLYLVLRKVLFTPVSRFMADRTRRIKDEFDRAARDTEKAEALRQEWEHRLETAEAEGDRIRQAARRDAEIEAAAIVERAKDEAKGLVEAAKARIADEERTSSARFRSEAAELVVAASSRVLRRTAEEQDARRAIAEMIAEASEQR